MRVGSYDHEGWEIPWSVSCRLKTRKASSIVGCSESWQSWWCRFQFKSKGLRTRNAKEGRRSRPQLNSQAEWIQPFSTCLSYSVPYWVVWNSPSPRRTECFLQSTSAGANLVQKQTHWTSGIMFDQTPLVAQTVKSLSAMRETWVWSLGQEDPLEKGMATHSGILVWEIPWTQEPGGL